MLSLYHKLSLLIIPKRKGASSLSHAAQALSLSPTRIKGALAQTSSLSTSMRK
jgi:hypothetical protein